ncbi:carnitine/acylcarnitine carrier protein [Ectocarpus siliculosus]|uniref:Carnitine/acylcarnitine carrier protein n=1 Tax=Ectocarpus siliculosus TaxID=2880 RepID=D7FLY9_ECTSI|nr:carnitine/acylcarnitine carrier protein [Ectocarpus siliculosus]|eukprot:CBJ29814.1 carnitine/acylcarnitine carrier protein [Ectocarpus siliculosus]
MAAHEGLMSWYRGLLSPVAGYGAMFAVSFSSYGMASRFLQRRRKEDGGGGGSGEVFLWEKSAAGFFAGAMNSPFRTVFDRVKTVMQVRVGNGRAAPYSWSGACAADLVRREGVMSGLFRGIESTMLREMLQCAIYYPSYEVTKDLLARRSTSGKSSVPEPALQMLAGGIAGCATWLPPVYCLDVIKTRLQSAEPGVYGGTWDCLRKTVRSEGTPVLFRGLGLSMLRAFPMHGLVFVGYETTIGLLTTRENCPTAVLANT